jgi:uncharacterized protein YbjT (DUF2867 family)
VTKKLLITGGSGVLGKHLIHDAKVAGFDIRVLSRGRPPAVPERAVTWVYGDLASGAGLREASADLDLVIHAASDFSRADVVDVEGTRRLLDATRSSGLKHFLYVSIVGVDHLPYSYFQHKFQAERLIESSGVPYTILRATQFHSFVNAMLKSLARVPLLMPLPARFKIQSVAAEEVAARVVQAIGSRPSNAVINFGGPEVLPLEAAATSWMLSRNIDRPIVRVPLPGRLARAFREARNTAPDGERGVMRWRQWLARTDRRRA